MKLKLFRVNEGGQFTEENKLEVDYDNGRKVALAGEAGEGKTTGLECFKLILGAIGGEKIINDLVNRDSGKLDIEQSFVGNDKKTYFIRCTKSQYYVREEGSTKNIGEPKTFIESHLGRIAADPMKYKNQDVDKLIKWLAGFSDLGEEGFEKEYNKQKEAVKNFENARASANKEAKARLVLLADAGYATDSGELIEAKWTAAEAKYKKPLDIKELSEKLTKAGTKSDSFLKVEEHLKGLQDNRTKEVAAIEKLKKELAAAEASLVSTDEQILKDKDWITKNKSYKTEYDAVKKDYDNAALYSKEYEAFKTILRHRKEMYEYQDIAQQADASVQAAEKKKKEIMWKVIPDIRGASILLEQEGDKPPGFYVGEFNSRQQSATEYLTAIVKILDKLGCRILILDDVATYGSEFRKLLEQLSKKGWYILYSLLKIDQELTIEYS